jgi:hypothetical protein
MEKWKIGSYMIGDKSDLSGHVQKLHFSLQVRVNI